MKILHTFVVFSPSGGGTVDLVYKITKALAVKGHEVEIYAGDYLWEQEYVDSLPEVKVRAFHDYSRFGGLYLTPGMAGELDKHIRDFDIVHLHCMRSSQNVIFHHYAKKYGIPYVLDTHGSLPRRVIGESNLKAPIRWFFDVTFGDRILRDAARVVAETQLGVNEYREFGIADNIIALIPPPFDVQQFSVLPPPGLFRERFNLGDKKLVTFLGRIHQIKGLDFLVKSFYELTKSRDDSVLVILGNDDGYKPTLESLITNLGVGNRILFTGFQGGDDKLSALVDSNVVVQTSVYEQGAWAPFEAILCGTPIIVTGHTGAGEDVRRIDAGYLVEMDNTTQMAQLINKVFDEPAEAKAKANKAAEHIRKNMSIDKRIEDYENLYIECIEETKKA